MRSVLPWYHSVGIILALSVAVTSRRCTPISQPLPPSSSLTFTSETDRPGGGAMGMRRRVTGCSQGACQMYLHSRGQTSFHVLPDSTITSFKPSRSYYPDSALLEMSPAPRNVKVTCQSHRARPIIIVGVLANAFVCMTSRGRVYASDRYTEGDCTFCEEHRTDLHFIYYRSLNDSLSDSEGRGQEQATPPTYSDRLYLGVNSRCAKMMDGRRGRACAQLAANQRTPHFCEDIQFVKVPLVADDATSHHHQHRPLTSSSTDVRRVHSKTHPWRR